VLHYKCNTNRYKCFATYYYKSSLMCISVSQERLKKACTIRKNELEQKKALEKTKDQRPYDTQHVVSFSVVYFLFLILFFIIFLILFLILFLFLILLLQFTSVYCNSQYYTCSDNRYYYTALMRNSRETAR